MTEQWKATREAIRLNELVAYAIIRPYKPIINIYITRKSKFKKRNNNNSNTGSRYCR